MGAIPSMPYHYQSTNYVCETPQAFFDALEKEFGFDIDVCALRENTKCPWFFSPDDNGLSKNWAPHTCWMNPPYGREIRAWMKKAYEESHKGATVVCLVPSRTDAAWWHDYAMKGEVRFVKGRLKFNGMASNAPFPNAVIIFRPGVMGTRPLSTATDSTEPKAESLKTVALTEPRNTGLTPPQTKDLLIDDSCSRSLAFGTVESCSNRDSTGSPQI